MQTVRENRKGYPIATSILSICNETSLKPIREAAESQTDFVLDLHNLKVNESDKRRLCENLLKIVKACFTGYPLSRLKMGVPDLVGERCLMRSRDNNHNTLNVVCNAENFNIFYDYLELKEIPSYGYDHENNEYLIFFVCVDVQPEDASSQQN